MSRKQAIGYALVAVMVLANCLEAQAICRWRLRSRRCCPPPVCRACPAPAPVSMVCTKWYFCQMGNLHLHYGGDPNASLGPCNPANVQMYLPERWCSSSGCPCPGTHGTTTYCEIRNLLKSHEENALKPNSTKEVDFEAFETELMGKGAFVVNKWKIPASGGGKKFVRVYKVTLNATWAGNLGYAMEYLAFQVSPTHASGYTVRNDLMLNETGKRGTIAVPNSAGTDTYKAVLLE